MSKSLIPILNALIATALYSVVGPNGVIVFDIGSFIVAFIALLLFIRIPVELQGHVYACRNTAFQKYLRTQISLLYHISGDLLLPSEIKVLCIQEIFCIIQV